MAELFASGRIADLVVLLLLLEGVALTLWRARTGAGLPTRQLLTYLASGLFLVLALRTALTGAWHGWTGLWLAAAGLAHAADLAGRWRGADRSR